MAFRDAWGQTLSESQTQSPEKMGQPTAHLVKYGVPLTIFSNFGKGSVRFLVPAGKMKGRIGIILLSFIIIER